MAARAPLSCPRSRSPKYGVVVACPDHPSRIQRFVEKPQTYVGNRINGGLYLLNPSVLRRIELRPTSIERETFPSMVADGELHMYDLKGFWMDVGQPKDFLTGTCMYLDAQAQYNPRILMSRKAAAQGNVSSLGQSPSDGVKVGAVQANGKPVAPVAGKAFEVIGNVLADPSATIGPGCRIGPDVTIGPGVTIGQGVRLQRCVILHGATIRDQAWVKSTIVGWNSKVGRWARLENVTILGEDVTVGDEVYINGGTVLPHKSIKANINEPQIIM